jgi:hypothetical protein
MDVVEVPRFDAYNALNGRSRIEAKIDNIVLARDAETQEVWRLARLSLYQGNDLWNEIVKSRDYEAEVDLRPRAWWGWLLAAEHHGVDDKVNPDKLSIPSNSPLLLQQRFGGALFDEDLALTYDNRNADFNRVLTYFYLGDASLRDKFHARMGFSYTETGDTVYNREVLYGLGYRLGDNWGIGFEQRYDLARDEMTQQKYQLRRNLHCWEAALTFRDRESGWDLGVEFNITALPTTRVKF